MRVLIVGGGGREHALAWRFARDDASLEIIAAPGNPGIAQVAECVAVAASDLPGLLALARQRAVHLVVVGPEAPLALGIVDSFREAGIPIFGPTRAAAEIETSKAFAKKLMIDAGIPTARAEIHTDVARAKAAVQRFGAPVVIKASGLASGKGVLVCASIAEADAAIDDMLSGSRFGEAGHEVLVEEFMEGEEVSVFALTDGERFLTLPALQDHKRLGDGDVGPNTGGMGAYLPVSLPRSETDVTRILGGTLRALSEAGRPFTGLLYAGLMITAEGPKVVEFNCRFGDPETQALLPALELDIPLFELMQVIASGRPLPDANARLRLPCVTTVLAARNYPEAPALGDAITIPAHGDDVVVFHAGTVMDKDGVLRTSGGRVLAVSAVGETIAEAQQRSLAFARTVEFAGKQFRSDIGWREIARTSGN